MSNDEHLSWSIFLGASLKKRAQLKVLWLLPHDVRRALIRRIWPRDYWRLMRFREGNAPPYDYSFCDRLGVLFVHVPKAAGTLVYKRILNGHTAHFTVTDYCVMFGKQQFDGLFKFAFVRNPWDRLVSAYFYLRHGGTPKDREWARKNIDHYKSFGDFVKGLYEEKLFLRWIHFVPQYLFLTDPLGRMYVDFTGKVEDITVHLAQICKKIGIDTDAITIKKENASKHKPYREYYTDTTIDLVADIYKKDIDIFGYTFDS